MDKKILEEYIDACELVKETVKEIKSLKVARSTVVQDSVRASMHDYPYAEARVHVEGAEHSVKDRVKKRSLERILEDRRNKAEGIKLQVEEWLNTIPVRMQRLIKYRVFEKLPWSEVARRMGRGATEDSVRMELDRFLEKK